MNIKGRKEIRARDPPFNPEYILKLFFFARLFSPNEASNLHRRARELTLMHVSKKELALIVGERDERE